MLSPDIIALQEIQDNNGATNDGTVDTSLTYQTLIAAIQTAGGPVYDWRDIAPVDLVDGGEPGGNIRVGFLFRTDRGLNFVNPPGGDAITATSVSLGDNGVELSINPGRIDPLNDAFLDSRKPLAAEFLYNGHTLVVIANHLNSN
jgi:predicted extracellular nuclease